MEEVAICYIVDRLARELRYMSRDCENQAIYGRNNQDRTLILAARSEAFSRASELADAALEEVRAAFDREAEVKHAASQ